jgi:hypothetical protein
MTLAEAGTVPFPNGFAGSIPAAVMGRFNFPLYLCALPVGVAACRLFPSGFIAYSLTRDGHLGTKPPSTQSDTLKG